MKSDFRMFYFSDFENTKNLPDHTNNFVQLVKLKWDEILNETNVFKYKIGKVKEKQIDKYILQLNPDRGTKRRTPQQIDNIRQPFDNNKFNFLKVSPREIIFNLVKYGQESDIHTLLVNVSPINRHHTLFCPFINKCLPQVVTEDSLRLAIEIMFLAQDRDLRIGFNSLCGLASVNHLHFHLLFEKNVLAVETVICKHLKGSVYYLQDHPAPAFCFSIPTQDSIDLLSKDIYKLLEFFLDKSIAHNILITRRQNVASNDKHNVVRVIVWPRKSSAGVKQLHAFNVAVCELGGWFPVFNEDYDTLKAEDLENELKKWKLDEFEDLCDEVQLLF